MWVATVVDSFNVSRAFMKKKTHLKKQKNDTSINRCKDLGYMKTPRGSVVTYCRVNGVRRTESAAYPCTQEGKQALRISSIYLKAKQIVQGYGQWSETEEVHFISICAYKRNVDVS